MSKENFLSLSEWAPDSKDRDTPSLQIADNVLPVYKSYRIIPKLTLHSESPDDVGKSYPLTGGISHLFDTARAISIMRPDGDIQAPVTYSNEVGGVSPDVELYVAIGETNADPTTFIYSRNTAADSYIASLSSPRVTPTIDTDHFIRFHYFAQDTPNAGDWSITISLLESGVIVDPGADPVTVVINFNDDEHKPTPPNTQNLTFHEIALSAAQAGAITNYDNLEVEFTFVINSFLNNSNHFPIGDRQKGGGWVNDVDDDGEYWNKVDFFGNDTFPGEAIEFRTLRDNNPRGFIYFDLPFSLADPIVHDNYRLQVKAAGLNAICQLTVRIHEGTSEEPVLVAHTFDITTNMETHVYIMTQDEMDKFSSFNGLVMSMVARFVTDDTILRVSAVALQLPKGEGGGLTWLEMEVPDPASQEDSDLTRSYVGDRNKLYEIRNNVTKWVDVSVLGGYGTVDEPQSWQFLTWGDEVYATNFVDEVQVKTLGNATFIDAITSPNKPKCKYIGAIQEHVLLANINDGSDMPDWATAGIQITSDMICWSALENATRFEIADLTVQSSFMRLRDTPGQITGFIGGEFGLAFKRNSVYRINYVGPPFVFGRDLLSHNIGCYYPRSIVAAGQDVFFVGNGGIYVIRDGQQLIKLGGDQVLRFLFDAEYFPGSKNRPITQIDPTLNTERDSVVVGAYDSFLDMIWWQYIDETEDPHNQRHLLLYSIRENRFSAALLDTYSSDPQVVINTPVLIEDQFDHILGELNTVSSIKAISKSILTFTWKPDDTAITKHQAWQFVSKDSPVAILRSKILSANYISRKGFRNIQINAVRVVGNPVDSLGTNFAGARVEMFGSEHPVIFNNFRTSSTVGSVADEDGWIPLNPPIHGEYFVWELTLPEFSTNNIREILGIDVRYEDGGGH